MKKLCSCLLIATISLGQFGVNGHALEKNVNMAPRVTQEKTSWLRENSQKNNTKTSEVEIDSKINEILNKEQAKNKKKSPRVTNVNVDLKVPAIVASVAAVAAVAFSKYSDIQVAQIQKEIKEIEANNNVFKKFYSATGESISAVWDSTKDTVVGLWSFGKENVPAAVDWTKDKTTALWNFGQENVPAVVDWTKAKYDSFNSWLIESGCDEPSAKLIPVVAAVGMSLLACFAGYKLIKFTGGGLKSLFNLPVAAGGAIGKIIAAPIKGFLNVFKSGAVAVSALQPFQPSLDMSVISDVSDASTFQPYQQF